MRPSREQFGRARDHFELEKARIAIIGFPDANYSTLICNRGGDSLPSGKVHLRSFVAGECSEMDIVIGQAAVKD